MGGLGIKGLLIAVQFLTVISFAPRLFVQEAELTAALSYFPFVGLIIGFLLAGVYWALGGWCQAPVLGVIETMTLAFLTRGLHLDGLADTFDAIGSGRPAEAALLIMKDSQIGALGAVSLILVLLLKSCALAEISRVGLAGDGSCPLPFKVGAKRAGRRF